jgi:hemoglobin
MKSKIRCLRIQQRTKADGRVPLLIEVKSKLALGVAHGVFGFTGAHFMIPLFLAAALTTLVGCGSAAPAKKENQEFFTSGSREADQRASQTMAKHEQLTGSGEGAGEKGVKKATAVKTNSNTVATGTTNTPAQAVGKLALFDRLGGEAGISNIVADITPRLLDDPRVNWARKEVKRGGLSIHRGKSVTWNATPENVAQLKRHLVQFFALATGGPAKYDGKEIKPVHAGMHIANSEFDAVVGDVKASLDKLQIPNKEQKELLAIIESTRPQIVEER